MTAELLAQLGGVTAASGLALLVLAVPRAVRLGGLALWVVGMALFVPLLLPEGQGRIAVAGGVALVALACLLAYLFRHVPWALAFLALAAVPARVPVTVGDESATLLIPIYAVVAGAAVALAWSLWRGENGGRELGRASWPAALFILWVGASALWAGEPKEAAVDLFFFVLPFGLLALALARLPWGEVQPGWLARLLVGMAFLFAVVGIAQWATQEIFWNEKVFRSNENSGFFRVNSLFWDPSIYGRFLVLAILATLVILLFARPRPLVTVVTPVVAVIWLGLAFSFSQSSFVALLVALAVLIVLAWGGRGALALGALVVVATVVAFAAPQLEEVRAKFTDPSSRSVNRATRGRFDLISKGIRIAADHPVVGVGIGNFPTAYEERFDPPGRLRTPASHTTPVTIAAETGVVGLALFAWFVAAALVAAFGTWRARASSARVTGLVAGFGIVAIFVHALFYSAFLEDPMAWGFVGLVALAARRAAPAGTEEAPQRVPPATLPA
jgi:O-antigen ligase